MKSFINQLVIEQKLFFRDKVAVFWTFFFPAILILLIGWFFTGEVKTGSLYVYDEDQTELSQRFIEGIAKSKQIAVKRISRKDYDFYIKENRGELIVHIHRGLQEKVIRKNSSQVTMYYNLAYGSQSETGITLFFQMLPELMEALTGNSNPVTIHRVNLGERGKSLRYIDFLTPGVIAMSLMSTCLFGVGIIITSYREKGKLRRLALTPLRKSVFILAHITHRYFVVLLQTVTLLLLAYAVFDLKFYGDVFSLLLIVTVGLLTFISVGFTVASRARKAETATVVANFLFFPMLLLGGVYFSLDKIPEVLRPMVNILPLSHLTDSLREVINYGKPFYTQLDHIFSQLVVMVVCFVFSVKAFRWE